MKRYWLCMISLPDSSDTGTPSENALSQENPQLQAAVLKAVTEVLGKKPEVFLTSASISEVRKENILRAIYW